jgi:hypothetical protein
MRKDLLQLLANHLRTVPPENFDLKIWHCGTTACAVGHAVNVPEIAAAGLYIDFPRGEPYGQPKMKDAPNMTTWETVSKVFDLSYWDALYLFDSNQYYSKERTPTHVADRIHKHIKETENA